MQSEKSSRAFWRDMRRQKNLHLMVLPALILLIVFNFAPLLGLQIAFKDFKFNMGIWHSPWVGLKHFQAIFNDVNIGNVLRNTLMVSFLKTFLLFPLPVALAVFLNECRGEGFKRVVQTVSYFPYFVSWPVVCLLAMQWMSTSGGWINDLLVRLGILDAPYFFIGDPNAFWPISVMLEIWKTTGYASIIYLSAITAIDQGVIEASVIDGAGRLTRIFHIVLPTIAPTVMVMMIMNIGNFLGGGLYGSNFQISYNLSNTLNLTTAEILDTYVLKIGIEKSRFSYATAISLLNSLVAGVLLVSANSLSRATTGESLF